MAEEMVTNQTPKINNETYTLTITDIKFEEALGDVVAPLYSLGCLLRLIPKGDENAPYHAGVVIDALCSNVIERGHLHVVANSTATVRKP